ncbi:MAG TPA: response regulator transcription factor [Saprospiraceae bacterium]|jgi:two-component system, OmpR family, response regulator VicR
MKTNTPTPSANLNGIHVKGLSSSEKNRSSGKKMKVLYVEDEEVLASLVKDHLERNGFEVCWTPNGSEAEILFQQKKPDLCILDIMLPGKSGYEIGKEIRKVDNAIPIIFLTARSESKDVVEGFKSGGNDYLKKPFSLEELMARVNNLFAMSGRGTPGQHRIGSMTFDPVRMVIQHEDQSISLSHRENELLKMLISTPGKPVERKQILLDLWGDDHFFNSRNLDVYITRLRKYLKMDPEVQLITLKGVGYQLVTG